MLCDLGKLLSISVLSFPRLLNGNDDPLCPQADLSYLQKRSEQDQVCGQCLSNVSYLHFYYNGTAINWKKNKLKRLKTSHFYKIWGKNTLQRSEEEEEGHDGGRK